MAIDIQALAREINNTLTTYTSDVLEATEESAKQRTKEGAQTLRKTSPELTGDYRKGWRTKKDKRAWVIHNATDYQLTHLLEKSHALVDGGRSTPQVHIAPVEEQVVNAYLADVEEAIRG